MANMNGRAPVTEGTSGTLRIATNGNTNGPKVDPKDPQVRKLVYNMYRVMLDQKHQRANDIIDSAPQELVSTDEGVGSRVQSMMRQQNELKGGNMNAGGPPPPPPPPPIPGIIPSSRLPSEIPARVPVMNPPAALAGAMLKDKKPFTYTPGGLDLSEINNQPRPQQNGNVATMDQPANGADLGPPIQSRSFRLLQNVLDHQDTADTPCNGMPMKVEVPLGAPTRPLQQSLSLPVYVTQTNGGQKGSLSQPGNMPRGSISQTSGQNNSMTSIGNSKNLQREVSDEWDGRFRVIPIQQSEEEINVIPKHIGGYKANISDTRGLSNIFKNQVRVSTDTDEARSRGGHFPSKTVIVTHKIGSDDEISNYMQQCVPQSHAPVHQGVQPRQHYNQIQNQQPIYQRPEIQGQPQQYQQTASNNKQLAQSKQKEVPTSSRFFRMLQTITDTLPEGAEPQGPVHIPNFRQQQKPPQMQQQGQYQQLGQYQQPGQYQQSNQNQQPGGVRSATAADQAVPEPKKYMGGSIPSRSFKMLQAMTNTDDASDDGDPATVSEATSPPDDDKQHAASQIPSPTWKSTVHNSPTSHSPSTLLGTNDTSSDSGISSSSKISPTYTTTKDSKVYRHVSPKITLNRGKDERVVNSALSHTKEPSSPFSQCSSPTWTSNTQAPRFFSPASQTPLGPNENNEDPELDRESPRLMKIIRQESTPHNEQKMTERRYEGGHIPSRVFRHLQTEYPGSSSESNDLQEIKSRTNYNSSCYERGPIPFRVVKSLQNENNNSFDSDASSSYAELDEYYCNGAAKTAVNKETVLKELTSQFDHTGLRRKPKAAPGKVFRYLQAQYDTLDLDKQESQHSNATLQPETEEAHGFGYRGSKVPSPSFKFLQNQYHKQQEDKESVAEETPTPDAPQYEEEPTPYRGARIPGRTFRSLQDNVSAHPSVFKPRQ